MSNNPKNNKVSIIAGPCAINNENIADIYRISKIEVQNRSNKKQRAIWGVRIVGLKSRTTLNKDGVGMGIDYPTFKKNLNKVMNSGSFENLELPLSVKIAESFVKDTNMVVATEIMDPLLQLPFFEKKLPRGKLFIWNPSVNQLGWPVMTASLYAKRNNWYIGLKNGKWLGDPENKEGKQTPMEKTWAGLTEYSMYGLKDTGNIVLIHRGVEINGKKNYRSLPIHQAAERTKLAIGAKLFFDPSHSFGPKLRNKIVSETIKAMKLRINKDAYLYDGILIEAGWSPTDTGQHITIDELEKLCQEIAKFRELTSPDNP